jgi:hypothetical protein
VGRPAAGERGELVEAFARLGAGLDVIDDAPVTSIAEVYGRGYLLIRPDAHIAWHGTLPDDPAGLASLVTGNSDRGATRDGDDLLTDRIGG